MAKDKNETAEQRIARLNAELAAAQEQVKAEQAARNETIAENVRKLVKMFGVATLGDVISLIKKVEKGVLGKLDASASRTYIRLSAEQRAAVKARLANGEQVSVIADSMGLQYGTVYAIKKGKTEEAVATSTTAETPATA